MGESVNSDSLREALAALAHEQWSGWMRYLFSKCGDSDVFGQRSVIPAWAVERWTRQMKTPYQDLPEQEKESDREEADRVLAILQGHEPPLWYKMGYDERAVRENDLD